MAKIKVTIKHGGQVEIKVEGAKGNKCTSLTKEVQDALGTTIKDIKTSEYYAQPQNVQQDLEQKL